MKKKTRDKYTKVFIYSIVVIFIIGFISPMLFR
ncbi:DUF4044 domain-containing protein [Clostridium sp. CM028]|nr:MULTISPECIES: DUF4044 domain-containing protein [Clostridium]MBU3091621.1 DUF4044 domain-containing protein [Clostridium sp. CF011]MBW9144114.1 DUF4044 domain-containing protein [Clostridium sp. CM027]MBW9147575.1 DUF4044 domain-containing protein [Clostridium sp. CM028]MBZ9608323.1 DUF4044 domain-containing protein [Clostridium estertheticum]UVE41243.1 DUF4044 domain-containing protein [Clostridium sp. CM027]